MRVAKQVICDVSAPCLPSSALRTRQQLRLLGGNDALTKLAVALVPRSTIQGVLMIVGQLRRDLPDMPALAANAVELVGLGRREPLPFATSIRARASGNMPAATWLHQSA